MVPDTEATVDITPICAHSLNKRSLVVSARDKITLELGQTEGVSGGYRCFGCRWKNRAPTGNGRPAGYLCAGGCRQRIVKLSGVSFSQEEMRDKLNGN